MSGKKFSKRDKIKINEKIHEEQNIKILNKDSLSNSACQTTLEPEAKGKIINTDSVFIQTAVFPSSVLAVESL